MTALIPIHIANARRFTEIVLDPLEARSYVEKEGAAYLIGKTCLHAERHGDEMISMIFSDGSFALMHHHQDCCESVEIEDINGDLADLLYTPILVSEERTQEDPNADDSATWTFYCLRTIKGSIDIRWYGQSNGYYGETASIDVREPSAPLTADQRAAFAAKIAAFLQARTTTA